MSFLSIEFNKTILKYRHFIIYTRNYLKGAFKGEITWEGFVKILGLIIF